MLFQIVLNKSIGGAISNHLRRLDRGPQILAYFWSFFKYISQFTVCFLYFISNCLKQFDWRCNFEPSEAPRSWPPNIGLFLEF